MKKWILGLLVIIIAVKANASGLIQKDFYLLEMVKIADIALKYHAEQDSNAILDKDTPFMVFSPDSKVFFVNDTPGEEFEKIGYMTSYLYNNISFHDYPWGQLSSHTEFNYPYQDNKICAIYIDPIKWNIREKSYEQNKELFLYISQQLVMQYMKNKINSYPKIPDRQYPLFDEENQKLLNIEMEALVNAWKCLQKEDKEKAKKEMEKFFSIRRDRWTKNRSFIMPFEQNEEMRQGYSAYQSLLLYKDLQNYIQNLDNNEERLYFKKYFTEFNEYDFIYHKIAGVYEGNVLSLQELSKKRLELSGLLQFMIFKELGWETTNLNRRDLWYILNDKVVLADSLLKSNIIEAKSSWLFSEYEKQIKAHNEEYNATFKELAEVFNTNAGLKILLNYDHKSNELLNQNQKSYNVDEGEYQIIPVNGIYRLKSNWIDLKLHDIQVFKSFNKNKKSVSFHLENEFDLIIDGSTIEKRDSLKMEFENLVINSDKNHLAVDSPGTLSIEDGILSINLLPNSHFEVDEEWWDKIEELNIRLIQKGVPKDWFLKSINNEKFKMYLNMKRLFTSMPEHKVNRGEVSQDAYMKNFGVDIKIVHGKEFINKYKPILEKAEKKNGIHYEMILGILAIESDFGNPRFKGTFYTFPALVSQYIFTPQREKFAVTELAALYDFSKKTKNDTYHFIGSYAGAAGWGQFIPSSMKTFFLDSNDNFSDIDIYSLEDNIVSIENYLYKNGLSAKNIDKYESRYKAVYSYNHSDSYVKAVLYMYDNLRLLRTQNDGIE